MLTRHSSRRPRLDQTVLNRRLDCAVSYGRIAGYFRSSLFEVAGDAIVKVFAVRAKNEKSDTQAVIERAPGIACDTLVPRGLDSPWRELSLVEHYYPPIEIRN